MSKGLELIKESLDEQLSAGLPIEYSTEAAWELARAAATYTDNSAQILAGMPTIVEGMADMSEDGGWWPWASKDWKPSGDPIKDLAFAGALIAGALDRLVEEQENGV